MTHRRAALLAALAATAVYLPSLRNRFALDDTPIVENNPAAHSVAGALRAVDEPYWPSEHAAGLWRPVTILSFAVDWELSGGSTTVLHATNVALHAVATGLLVPVMAAYVGTAAALAGALVFAVHPVHVEAVANLVGRAEMLAAVFLLAALLLARHIRKRRTEWRATCGLEASLLACVAAALLTKEHAVVAVALLWLDALALRANGEARLPLRVYAAVVAITGLWFLAHRAVEAGLAFYAAAPTFFGLNALGRLATMLPVVLVVLRLFVWPYDLSPDYHPHVVERYEQLTPAGGLGLAVALALAALAVLLWRRNRAVSVGLVWIAIAWAPTANIAFAAGIVLAERTLYLPSIGLALLVAAAARVVAARAPRTVAAMALVAALVPLTARTWVQIPVWRSTRDLVVYALLTHPESYKVHQSAARVYVRLGDQEAGLREYGLAIGLYDQDPYLLAEAAGPALQLFRPREALQLLRLSERQDAHHTLTLQYMANALLLVDSAEAAFTYARRAVESAPTGPEPSRILAATFIALGLSDSAVAVWPAFVARGGSRFERWLLAATTWAALGNADSAGTALDSARLNLPQGDTVAVLRFRDAAGVVAAARSRSLRGPPPVAERESASHAAALATAAATGLSRCVASASGKGPTPGTAVAQ